MTADSTRRPPRLLVVDDEPVNRRLMRALFSSEGFEVVLTEGGREALVEFADPLAGARPALAGAARGRRDHAARSRARCGAGALARGAQARAHPVLVVMTDGRANIARDGRGDRPAATADALSAARLVRAAGVKALFLDTAPRPSPAARLLAKEMDARYLPLPYLDAAGISWQVQALSGSGSAGGDSA